MAEPQDNVSRTPAPARRDPFAMLRAEMDRLFDDFTGGSLTETFPRMFGASAGTLSPHTDIKESEKEIVVTAELPGVSESDVSVTLNDGVLTLKGEKRSEDKQDTDTYRMVERRYGSFERSFRLPETIDEDNVDAKFADGILKITIAKKPEAQRAARKIAVSKG